MSEHFLLMFVATNRSELWSSIISWRTFLYVFLYSAVSRCIHFSKTHRGVLVFQTVNINLPWDLYRPLKSSSVFVHIIVVGSFFHLNQTAAWKPITPRPGALCFQVRRFHYVDFPGASLLLRAAVCRVIPVLRSSHYSAAQYQNIWIRKWFCSSTQSP